MKPGEHKTVQARILGYAAAIGHEWGRKGEGANGANGMAQMGSQMGSGRKWGRSQMGSDTII